jgi:hypothetical protein
VARIHWLVLPILLTACANLGPPASFLRAESKSWNDWMNEKVDVDIANVPLGSLGTRPQFKGMNVVLNGVDSEYRVALQAQQVSRRQALWQLANQYGLSLTVSTAGQGAAPFVVITNREIRHENRPLP